MKSRLIQDFSDDAGLRTGCFRAINGDSGQRGDCNTGVSPNPKSVLPGDQAMDSNTTGASRLQNDIAQGHDEILLAAAIEKARKLGYETAAHEAYMRDRISAGLPIQPGYAIPKLIAQLELTVAKGALSRGGRS